MKKLIGLTGGLGSGKSTIRQWLAPHVFQSFDADVWSREILVNHWAQLPRVLGVSLVRDRDHLKDLLLQEPSRLAFLEQFVHPRLAQRLDREYQAASGTCLYEAALLLEKSLWDKFDLVIVCCCPWSVRLKRVQASRPGFQIEGLTKLLLAGQMSDEEREQFLSEARPDIAGKLVPVNTNQPWPDVEIHLQKFLLPRLN